LYFLLPDRFSDGGEASRPLFDRANPGQFRAPDKRAWMEGGKKFQGGTLKGIASKLDYLKELGVTALWIGPIWRQRPDLETYHGYGIQNFLDVDARFGTRQDLRDLVDAAHVRGIYVLLDIIYNHTGNNWFYRVNGDPRETLPYRFQPPYPFHRLALRHRTEHRQHRQV
jgi:glycosidase